MPNKGPQKQGKCKKSWQVKPTKHNKMIPAGTPWSSQRSITVRELESKAIKKAIVTFYCYAVMMCLFIISRRAVEKAPSVTSETWQTLFGRLYSESALQSSGASGASVLWSPSIFCCLRASHASSTREGNAGLSAQTVYSRPESRQAVIGRSSTTPHKQTPTVFSSRSWWCLLEARCGFQVLPAPPLG